MTRLILITSICLAGCAETHAPIESYSGPPDQPGRMQIVSDQRYSDSSLRLRQVIIVRDSRTKGEFLIVLGIDGGTAVTPIHQHSENK